MSTVLVAGATGWVGGALVNELHRRGHSIVALVRPGTDASQLAEKACIVQGDVRNRETWSDAAPPCDCLVSCLGLRWWEGPISEEDVCNVMHDGLLNVFHAAAEGGARHVVILAPIPPCDALGRPLNHDIVRRARESAIRRIQAFAKHSCSGSASDLHGEGLLQPLKWTVVECSTFFKEFDLVHAAVQQLDGHFVVFGKGACETRMNPISARDVASCLADAVLNEWCYNKRIRVGGPDTHTLRQVVGMAADPAEPQHPVRLHTLPLWVGHVLVAVLRLLSLFFTWAATAHRVALSLLDVCRDKQPGGLVGVPCGADTLSAYAQHVHEMHQQRRLASDQDSNSGGALDDDWHDVKAQVYTAGRYNGLTHKQVLMTAAEAVLANHRERQRSVSLEQQLTRG